MIGEIGFEVRLGHPYAIAREAVIEALRIEGFRILTQIDVKRTLKTELDLDFREYTIIGVCNPQLAFRALDQDAVIGLLLPFNITVESDESGGSVVRVVNPEVLFTIGVFEDNLELISIARDARIKLERVAEFLLIH
jgi:uncharacterized protein (DUF302 family)